ncbi:hypothetical protein [Lichenibacterium dinghuense]|uniref:hypothetical protein n=1 Tax=Lichenibacterium dinghuense TaxID=2895977 RepID=UPI001F3546BC|nr:hypothetical protein [Lichenibacterium sp. 6Y81]
MKNKALLGLSSGIAAVVATLVGVALFNPPQTADAAVVHSRLVPCPLAAVAIDSGYGVTSKELRPVCPAERSGGPN